MTPETLARCRDIIQENSRSFALASRLLPRPARDRAIVVYAWCRRADDAIDEVARGDGAAGVRGASHAGQRDALARLERELDDVAAGRPTGDPIVEAFAEVVRACRIPLIYPRELLAGMASDVGSVRMGTMDELLRYGYRVAGTVGLMMCHLMGLARQDAIVNAAHLGVAMQLTNICRDVAEDWARDRLYLPRELLARHGAGALADHTGGSLPREHVPALAATVADALALADRYYRSGDAGLSALPWQCAIAIAAARAIYAEIGAVLRARGCDVTAGRAVVPGSRKLVLAARALARGAAELPHRARRARGVLIPRSRPVFTAPARELAFADMPRL